MKLKININKLNLKMSFKVYKQVLAHISQHLAIVSIICMCVGFQSSPFSDIKGPIKQLTILTKGTILSNIKAIKYQEKNNKRRSGEGDAKQPKQRGGHLRSTYRKKYAFSTSNSTELRANSAPFMDPCNENCGEKPIGDGRDDQKQEFGWNLGETCQSSSVLGFGRDRRLRRVGEVSGYGLGCGARRTDRIYYVLIRHTINNLNRVLSCFKPLYLGKNYQTIKG